jgi:Lar family restriction alleviation protein
MDELKPCPFCGGIARLEQMGWPHHVFCTLCGAKVTGIKYGEEGEQEAVEKWNRRTG